MIYLDNAATTLQKPPAVSQAVVRALSSFGGVGRGVHEASLAAGAAVYEARVAIAELLDAPDASRVAFCANATGALNCAVEGLLKPGAQALTTAAAHNSVLRPLFRARDTRNCKISIAPLRRDGSLDYDVFAQMVEGVAVVILPHASNVTGEVYEVARLAHMSHEAGAKVVLDAAQTAGVVELSMVDLDVDVVCFTGHKSLYGPQGTGGMCVATHVNIDPFMEGGSGSQSFEERHPRAMPESLEAGTLNAHGIAGLAAGVNYVQQQGVANLAKRVSQLTYRFVCGVAALPQVRVLGQRESCTCGIVSLVIGDKDSALVADELAKRFNIATRAGAHCAPLMHRALGTEQQGAVRFSFSSYTTEEEIDTALAALAVLAGE